MKYISKINENIWDPKEAREPGFDEIFLEFESFRSVRDTPIYNYQIKNLNDNNNNFDPSLIMQLFIDFYDNSLILEDKITKIYKVGIQNDRYHLSYKIEVNFTIEDKYSDKILNLRKSYLEERNSNLDTLYRYYGHRSLNQKLNYYNAFYKLASWSTEFLNKEDKFDLFSKFLFL